MALSHCILFRKELEGFISEIKEGKPEEEIIAKYMKKIDVIANKRIHNTLWRVLMRMYDDDSKKLEADISMITLLQAWGGSRRKALAVLYPAIKDVMEGFVISDNINKSTELWLTEPRIYDNEELPIL